jgi:hypothetical protein
LKPSVYVETSVVSYYVSRHAREVVAQAHQRITQAWWETSLPHLRAFVSPVVIEEARQGDRVQAARRLAALSAFEVLPATTEVERLAKLYMHTLALPAKALRDAAHLAFASIWNMDYLVSWNCAHIANAAVIRQVSALNRVKGIPVPTICTPEELMGRHVCR